MKKLIVLVVLLAAGYAGFRWWQSHRAAESQAMDLGRPTTALVIQTNINFAVNAAGEIIPAEQVSVRPEINGKIDLLPVDIGDTVKKGALLFKLDDKELRQEQASSKTAVERAQLELEKAKRDFDRSQDLLAAKLISQELFDDTKTTYELAKNSVDRAQKDLALIDERLTKTEVRAPFDCTVLTRPISAGQAVSGSGGFNSGTEVLTIADLNSMIINAHVNQADVPRLSVNQRVNVTVEAVPGLTITGTVERIAPQATIKNNIKGFATRILLRNVDHRVRPGMTANVEIPVASASNVLAVPLAAVNTERNPETGVQERYVFVKKGETFERRPVQIGVSDYFYAEVQAGLNPGEVVALEIPKEEQERLARTAFAGTGPGASSLAKAARPAGQTNARPALAATNAPALVSTNAPSPATGPAATTTAPAASSSSAASSGGGRASR